MKSKSKLLVAVLLFIGFANEISYTQIINNLNLISNLNVRPNQPVTGLNSIYSAIWGWTSPEGNEYAILCCVTGTSFINITDNSNIYESDFIPNYLVINRECKTFQNYAYITSERNVMNSGGLQIIDLQYLPDSVHLVKTWTDSIFQYAHTIYQENNYLYLCGGNSNEAGGIAILDISDPENPVRCGDYRRDFVHDCYVRNDTIYAALTFLNKFVIIDAVNKDSIREIVEIANYPGYDLPHSCWVSDDRKYLFTCDESWFIPGIAAVWDIQDFDNINFVTAIRPNNDNTSIAHNVVLKNNILYLSHHTGGLRLFDITNPVNPVEFAYHDTYPISNQPIIAGNWGVFPFFQSGKIISSDMQTGLYVHSIIDDPTSINILSFVVSEYSLSQNYPNPFNPKTVISYELQVTSFAKLKVYDVLGNEIVDLVNEKQIAGTYSVKFDGSNFSSGVYFYKLEAGDYTETRRMVLIK